MEKKTRFPSPTLKASVPWNAGKMVGAKRALKDKARLGYSVLAGERAACQRQSFV
ncbi:hypothetical protein ACLEIY_19045 [Acetobacter tropicalis]|uniref:hypothetical protein n=1 Tax=Acetobacter tropicalis TaxID=104102 RepID=UPI003975ECB6